MHTFNSTRDTLKEVRLPRTKVGKDMQNLIRKKERNLHNMLPLIWDGIETPGRVGQSRHYNKTSVL